LECLVRRYFFAFFPAFAALVDFFRALVRCCGGLFATAFTARSKRSIASGWNSMSFEDDDFAMPQPINRIVTDPHVVLNSDTLSDKPEFAIIICEIFAIWASIERDLKALLVRLLGAEVAPAHAIFSILQTQALQSKALEAAAKATLDVPGLEAFTAFMIVTESAQKTRNRLAHWAWGSCKNRPDLFVLADPDMLKRRDVRAAAYFQSQTPGKFDPEETWKAIQFEDDYILAYTKADLLRELRDIKQAENIAHLFGVFLDPSMGFVHAKVLDLPESIEEIRELALARLNEERLFRLALDRTRASQKSNRQPLDGSNPQGPDGK
jgi:hypothetical protein